MSDVSSISSSISSSEDTVKITDNYQIIHISLIASSQFEFLKGGGY
jgi:hypothetical protein